MLDAVQENKNKILKVNDNVRCVLKKICLIKEVNLNGQQKYIS